MGIVIEGKLAEVQQRLDALSLSPETHLRVVVDEKKETDEGLPADRFTAPKEKRNGVTLFPIKAPGVTITTEMVKAMLEDE